MSLLTLDASVWISAFTPGEPDHEASRNLVDALLASRRPLVEPTLFLVEIAGAIARRRDPDIASEVAQAAAGLPWIRWIALDDDMARLALALACQHRLARRRRRLRRRRPHLRCGPRLARPRTPHAFGNRDARLFAVGRAVTTEHALAVPAQSYGDRFENFRFSICD
jgi:predicted nucleic acid-binding protein